LLILATQSYTNKASWTSLEGLNAIGRHHGGKCSFLFVTVTCTS